MPYELLKAASETMKHTTMVQGYGMTETSPIISFLNWKYAKRKIFLSINVLRQAPCGVETKLCDINVDGVGELAVRGPSIFSGYYNRTDECRVFLKMVGSARVIWPALIKMVISTSSIAKKI